MSVVCAFDEKAIENGPFAGVEGVGQYGYRCRLILPMDKIGGWEGPDSPHPPFSMILVRKEVSI